MTCSKNYGVALLAVLAVCGLLVQSGHAGYTTKYDGLDVDRILMNERLLLSYFKCLLDEGPCAADAKELKKILPHALTTGCQDCNDKQKVTAEKVIRHIKEKKPAMWMKLQNRYDPNHEFEKRYRAQN